MPRKRVSGRARKRSKMRCADTRGGRPACEKPIHGAPAAVIYNTRYRRVINSRGPANPAYDNYARFNVALKYVGTCIAEYSYVYLVYAIKINRKCAKIRFLSLRGLFSAVLHASYLRRRTRAVRDFRAHAKRTILLWAFYNRVVYKSQFLRKNCSRRVGELYNRSYLFKDLNFVRFENYSTDNNLKTR